MTTRRQIGEWSPDHPGTRVDRVRARPREAAPLAFALDAEGRPRRVEPDHPNRAARRGPDVRYGRAIPARGHLRPARVA